MEERESQEAGVCVMAGAVGVAGSYPYWNRGKPKPSSENIKDVLRNNWFLP